MTFIELIVTINLKKNVYFQECGYIIGKNINKSMLLDKDLKNIHPKNEFKNYVFNSFYPIEKDKIYKKDKVYVFKVRGLSEEFINKLYACLYGLNSNDFQVLSVARKKIYKRNMQYIYTQTPLIITVDNRPWLQESDDIELFKSRLEDNIEKKYKNFFNEDIDIKGRFIKEIEFKNRTPMVYNYKGVKLLSNKIKLDVQNNEEAQIAAFMARAVGLGEKNSSVGAGFCE